MCGLGLGRRRGSSVVARRGSSQVANEAGERLSG